MTKGMNIKEIRGISSSRSLVKQTGVIDPHSDLRTDLSTEKTKRERLQPGTWKVQTILSCGKLENVKEEMKRLGIDVLGLSKVRQSQEGDFWSGDYRVICNM